MKLRDKCTISATLAAIIRADVEDDSRPQWTHDDQDRCATVSCIVDESRVVLTLALMPDDAERVVRLLADLPGYGDTVAGYLKSLKGA